MHISPVIVGEETHLEHILLYWLENVLPHALMHIWSESSTLVTHLSQIDRRPDEIVLPHAFMHIFGVIGGEEW